MGMLVVLHSSEEIIYNISVEEHWVLSNLKTNKSQFKIHAAVGKYRKGLNSTLCLHNFLQESLISRGTNRFNHHHEWFISIMGDDCYRNEVLNAIKYDIKKINNVLNKYTSIHRTPSHDLVKLHTKLCEALESFELYFKINQT